MALSRDQILSIGSKLKIETVTIPGWTEPVCVREFTAGERDMIEGLYVQSAKNPNALKDFRARIACYSLCDEQGNRLFQDSDIQHLTKLSGAALDAILDAVQRISGMSKLAVEEAEKN